MVTNMENKETGNSCQAAPEPPACYEERVEGFSGVEGCATTASPASAAQTPFNQTPGIPSSADCAQAAVSSAPISGNQESFTYSYQQVSSAAPEPLQSLSAGMKACWLLLGFGLSFYGVILAWLVYVDRAPKVKTDAVVWSAVGFAIGFLLGCFAFLLVFLTIFIL